MHTPFKLTLSLATPFYLSQTLTLDGLLSAAVFRKTGLMCQDTVPHIPLSQHEGIFKGSSLFCHPQYRHMIVGRVMALRGKRDLSEDVFSPNKRSGKEYGYIDKQRGPYKSNLDAYPGISAEEVYFWGVGDPQAVDELLRDTIIGIGKRSNAGAGEITALVCDEIEDDFSWVTKKGKPARPLPLSVWCSMGRETRPSVPMSVTVPYWGSEVVQAVFPESLIV